MQLQETTTYLEMTDWTFLRPSLRLCGEVEIRRASSPYPELSRFFYTAIGGDWYWVDRLNWTYAEWLEYLNRPGHETWTACLGGTPAGYFELQDDGSGRVEIASFGLLPQFLGQGIGGRLLTAAVDRAWDKGAARVWLHTSSFDHPRALENYLARGFVQYKQETFWKELPDAPPGPWPGARRPRLMQSEA